MNLLKNLLDMHQAAGPHHDEPEAIQEARGGSDMRDLLDKWYDAEGAYSWEGQRGVSNFEKLIKVLGYRDMDSFLSDNPGALEALLEFIMNANVNEWEENLNDHVGDGEVDD